MAARQQQKGTGSGIQYEDLVPKSEWKDQPEATLLTIDLPGFTNEQIKVTYVHTSKMIRVTGERPVADRRWNRFNEVFTVPQNCLVDKIHGSFKNNVLTITMPKETITKMDNLPEASKTVSEKVEKVEKLEEQRLLEEARRKEMVEEAEKMKKKKLLEEKEGLIRKLQEEAKAKEKLKEKRVLEETKRKEMVEEAEKMKKKLLEEKERLIRELQEEAKAKEKLMERKLVEEATREKMIQEMKSKEKILKPEERKLPQSGPGSGGVSEMVKSAEEILGYLVEKEKKIGQEIMEKIRGKEITSEEKKLMVNVGVAALVIFALGAFVSYTFCSSSSSSSSSSSTKRE